MLLDYMKESGVLQIDEQRASHREIKVLKEAYNELGKYIKDLENGSDVSNAVCSKIMDKLKKYHSHGDYKSKKVGR